MKDRKMSGIQNIKKLAQKYKYAEIYFHIDLDGVTSAIAMKEYLKRNGITVVDAHKINYGADEYNIVKPRDGNMGVMVDFSHSKPFIQIHTDHHLTQITNGLSSNHFKSSKSNATTISSIIGQGIFSEYDEKAINMIDSAGFLQENIKVDEVGISTFKCGKKDSYYQHLRMALACNKLLLTYKNKMRVLEDLVINCSPSLLSIYLRLSHFVKENLLFGIRGWVKPEEIDENVSKYVADQKKKSFSLDNPNDLLDLGSNQLVKYNNVIVQIGGGYMKRVGSYERYTPFRVFPRAEYLITIWDELGMLQVSRNPWSKKENKKDLHHLVNNIILPKLYGEDIFKTKISLMAVKKEMEKNIDEFNEKFYDGFTYNDFYQLFDYNLKMTEEEKDKIIKCMSLKYSKFFPQGDVSEARKQQSMKMIRFLNDFRVPLDVVLSRLSGGHKEITNFVGLNLLNSQYKIDIDLENNKNPYEPINKEDLPDEKNETKVFKFLKLFALNILYELIKK